MIVLTAEQADAVRGVTGQGAALEPVALADGVTFALPEAVLSDPAHTEHRDYLLGLPRRAIQANEWPQSE